MSEQKEITAKKTPKKTALGRGLGSLLGNSTPIEEEPLTKLPPMKSETNSALKEGFIESPAQPKIPDTARVWKIAVDKIYPNVNQPRQVFDAEPLKELSASIREKGVLQPIVARKMPDGGYEIIAGERRWRAAQQAGLHEVPVILKESDDQEAMELALIENIQRADLNPVEEAEAYAHLIKKYNLTQQKLAEQVGKDRVTIANTMRLLNLAPEVRVMVSKGRSPWGRLRCCCPWTTPRSSANWRKRCAMTSYLFVRLKSWFSKDSSNLRATMEWKRSTFPGAWLKALPMSCKRSWEPRSPLITLAVKVK